MLENYFTHGKVLRRHRAGLLGPYLDSFTDKSKELGYTWETVRSQCYAIRRFGKWLGRRRLRIANVNDAVVARYVRDRQLNGKKLDALTVERFARHLQALGVVAVRRRVSSKSACDIVIERFRTYLTTERVILAVTAGSYAEFARELLMYRYPRGVRTLRTLREADVSAFVVHWTRTHRPGRAKLLVTALRAFFRFLLQSGDIDMDLALAVPAVAGWRLASVPKYLDPKDVERVLASSDRRTGVGRRDYAILVLLARLGIRACEVVRLRIDDIDWRSAELVVRGKGAREDRLPLTAEVGRALADYLKRGRPHCASRRVFLRSRAPIRELGHQSSVRTIVGTALRRAALDPPVKGSHILRHSLATRMLGAGASMAEIAQVLRHQDPQTTEIYAKVDFSALRSIALPWPRKDGGR